MVIDYIWANANPQHQEVLRRANEARAAAHYAAWKAVGRAVAAPFRALAARVRRARRVSRTYRELQALDDRQLQDIGLARSEILGVASAVVERPGDEYPTIAELRRAEPAAAGEAAPAGLPAEDDRRQRTSRPRDTRRPATAATAARPAA